MTAINASRTQICAAIENYVRDIGNIRYDDDHFDQHTELFESGYVDSLSVVALTAYIEQEFGVVLAEEDLFDPNFTTIAGMAQIVAVRTARLAGEMT